MKGYDMKTVFYVREKDTNGRYLCRDGKLRRVGVKGEVIEYESLAEAEHDMAWRIQHGELPTGEYVYVPHATI